MAIEFHCPGCEASIRVPDAAAGKRGSCPSCGLKMMVPIPTGGGADTETPPAAPANDAPPAPSAPAEAPPVPSADAPTVAMSQSPDLGGPAPEPAVPDFTAGPSERPPSISKRVKRRRKKNWAAILIPVFLCIGMVGGITYLFWPSDALEGTLTATVRPSTEIPLGQISGAETGADESAVEFVLSDLAENPQILKSSLVDTEIRGSADGLEFRLFPNENARVVMIDYSKNAKLKKYVEEFIDRMDKLRREELDTSSKAFIESYYGARRDNPRAAIPDLGTYRNSMVLTSMRGGFGHHLAAVAGKKAFPCVYEGDAKLYFIIPSSVKKFELKAYPNLETKVEFPGLYQVKVKTPKAVSTDKTQDEEPEPSDDDTEMTDDE